MNDPYINILERIHGAYYQLSAAERKVADYILSQHSQVQFMSITQLADECDVAEATVSRFCRNLGLKGFNAFKLEMARHTATTNAGHLRPQQDDTESLSGRCLTFARLSQDAITQTVDMVNTEQLESAVELLEKAGKVLCMGAGGSVILAAEFAHLFSTVTDKFFAIADSHIQTSLIATLGTEDVVVLFSYSGATFNGISLLELAQKRKIPTILVTRFPKSPAAQKADVVLCCGSTETPFQFGSVPAAVAQLVLMDFLYQEYFRRNREKCEENIQNIAMALAEKHI